MPARSTMLSRRIGLMGAMTILFLAALASAGVAWAGGATITVNSTWAKAVINRGNAEYGLARGDGVILKSIGASGYGIQPNEGQQGVGLEGGSGGLAPDGEKVIATRINTNYPNGVYYGTYTLTYSDGNTWYDGPIVRYTIILTGQQTSAFPCRALADVQRYTGLPMELKGTCTFTASGLKPNTVLKCMEGFLCQIGKPDLSPQGRHTVVTQGPAVDTGDTLTMVEISSTGFNLPVCQMTVRLQQSSPWPVLIHDRFVGYVINPNGGSDDGCTPFFRNVIEP